MNKGHPRNELNANEFDSVHSVVEEVLDLMTRITNFTFKFVEENRFNFSLFMKKRMRISLSDFIFLYLILFCGRFYKITTPDKARLSRKYEKESQYTFGSKYMILP